MNHSRKVLLIGWDAADWKVIHPLMDAGKMPTLQKLISNGVMGNMATLFPPLSPMLWTTISTGKRPHKHGIYGFTEPTPDRNAVQPMTIVSRKCKAIWNILNQHQKRSVVVGWWPSNPAEPINGAMVSDFFHKVPRRPGDSWSLPKNCIHPPELHQQLLPMRLHPNHLQPKHLLPFIPLAAEIDQESDPRLSMAMKVICEAATIHRAADYLLQTQEWDFAAVYYDAIDHFSHGFMKYHPPKLKQISDEDFRLYQNVVQQGYIFHDQTLAKLLETAGDDVTVILMSDHGFHPDELRPAMIPNEPAGPAIEHRDLGIFVISGPGIKKDEVVHGAGLCDITPTVLALYGLPVGEDMDGRVLDDVFEEVPEIESIPSWEDIAGDDGRHPTDIELDPGDSKQALEQLIALGYIDRPSDDKDEAVANCQCELDYNLARALMDAQLHGQAIPLFEKLYNDFPLEFRFGLQLCNALKAMNRMEELKELIDDLNSRWRIATQEAKKRLRQIRKVSKERRLQWREFKKLDEENEAQGLDHPKLALKDQRGRPVLFSDPEKADIRKVRSVAKGNPGTLDYLAATVHAAGGEFESALELLQSAKESNGKYAGFLFQLGNVYLGLERVDDAIDAYLAGLDIDQYHPSCLMGLCRASLEKGELKKAEDFGVQAIGINYFQPLAHYYLGNARQRQRQFENAVTSYETALNQNPNFVEAHRELAKIYQQSLPNNELALEHKHAAKELNKLDENFEAFDPLEIKPAKDVDYAEILPDFELNTNAKFLRCLTHPKPTPGPEMAELPKPTDVITIVSGLPRSGTSMMMQLMVAAGLEPYVDDRREADESNPKGYFESQDVKKIAHENNWLENCQGKVVKIVAPLIPYLPQGYDYRVILMNRDIGEIVESQEKMLERLDRSGGELSKERFESIFQQQLRYCRLLFRLHGIPYIEPNFKDMVATPKHAIENLVEFLGAKADITELIAVVDPKLYRQRKD